MLFSNWFSRFGLKSRSENERIINKMSDICLIDH